MIANYHTHTWRCNHAVGQESEYVENAIAAGLRILGFSDHSPYLFPGDHDSWFRMRPEQLEDYVQTVLALRKRYHGKIDIPIGLEMEYYPDLIGDLLPLLRDQPLDYLILGQHVLGNEVGEPFSGTPTEDKTLLMRYCDQSMDAMQSGLFTYFAHPDLCHYVGGDSKFYSQQIRRLCQEANSCGIPLEINILGISENKHYPNLRFWEVAAEENCSVVLGRDAHKPEQLLDSRSEQKALEIVQKFALKLLDTVELRKI